MMTTFKKQKKTAESPAAIGANSLVELVAGPHCGAYVLWGTCKRELDIDIDGRIATYQYEGNRKAVWKNRHAKTPQTTPQA